MSSGWGLRGNTSECRYTMDALRESYKLKADKKVLQELALHHVRCMHDKKEYFRYKRLLEEGFTFAQIDEFFPNPQAKFTNHNSNTNH